MTVIRPNSVSGITSITAQANEINFFRSNGTLAGLQLNGVNFNTTTGISTLAALKITGNLDVAGVLTYQDVTNVDSVGIITARSGITLSGGVIKHTGQLKLIAPAGNSVRIRNHDDSDNVAVFNIDDSTHLYYDSSHKFSTVSDGIDVIGNILMMDSLTHRGDTDTKIRFPADNTVTVETAGSERLRIAGDGNISIGGNFTAGRKVHIKDAGQIKLENTTTGGWAGLEFMVSSGTNNYDAYMGMQDSNGLFFIDNNSNGIDLCINRGGKVFIGADSTDFSDEGTFLNIRNNTYGGRIGFSNNTATAGVTLMEQFAYWGNNKVAGTIIAAGTDTTNKDDASMSFYTRNGGSVTERLRIDSNGHIIFSNKLTNSSSFTSHNTNFYGGDVNTGGVRIEVAHSTTSVSGNTASGAFPHHLLLSNYSGNGSADNRMCSIGFDIPTTSTHANAVIAYQATSAGTGDLQFHLESGNSISEKLRIQSAGGISFNGDSAAANALDDYEEGSLNWHLAKSGTPSLGGNNGSNVKYVKVGRLVHISGRIRTDGCGSDGSGYFVFQSGSTLPFTPETSGTSVVGHWRSQDNAGGELTASISWVAGSTTLYLYTIDSRGDYTAGSNNVPVSSQTNLVITFSLTYRANS